MKKIINFYYQNFAPLITITVFIFASLFIGKIPYLNLFQHFFSTAFLVVALLFVHQFFKKTFKNRIRVLFILLFISYLLHILGSLYLSEIVGNIFYLYLFYVAIIEAKETISVHE